MFCIVTWQNYFSDTVVLIASKISQHIECTQNSTFQYYDDARSFLSTIFHNKYRYPTTVLKKKLENISIG